MSLAPIAAAAAFAMWLLYYFLPPRRVAGWYAGPIIRHWLIYRKDYSKVRLLPLAGGVLQFDLTGGEIDALCLPVAPLPNTLTIEYELTGSVTPSQSVASLPLISIAFGRKGDNWSGDGDYQHYRWYASQADMLRAGKGSLTVDFNSTSWGDVMGGAASALPAQFAAAKADVGTLFITFGYSAGRSHGVTGAAQFKLLSVTTR